MRALLRWAMYGYDIAFNTHLEAQSCENGVGWFIQLETQLWLGVWAHEAVSGVRGTILVVLWASWSEL